MADQSIFESGTQSDPSTQQPSSTSGVQNLLATIVNERGEQKYKTIEEALVGLSHAQSFIQTLKTEKHQVEQQVNELRPVADKVSELEKVVLQLSQSKPPEQTAPSGMTEDAVASLVEQTLTRQQQQRVAKDNLQKVAEVVKKNFGDKAEEAFYGKAAELGFSKEDINALAARSPQAALKLIGVNESVQSSVFSPTTTSVNTSSLTPQENTFISRNKVRLEVGATAHELMQETASARKMVEELNAKGMSIDDLTKPSNYFKFFK